MAIPSKLDPITGQTLYPLKRVDGTPADSAWLWQSLDEKVTIEPTIEEDDAISAYFDTDRSITGR